MPRVIAGVVVACAIYANLSFAITKGPSYRYFPPFVPNVNGNGNKGLGGEYFNTARARGGGRGSADPFVGRPAPPGWKPPILPAILAGLLWLSDGNHPFVIT